MGEGRDSRVPDYLRWRGESVRGTGEAPDAGLPAFPEGFIDLAAGRMGIREAVRGFLTHIESTGVDTSEAVGMLGLKSRMFTRVLQSARAALLGLVLGVAQTLASNVSFQTTGRGMADAPGIHFSATDRENSWVDRVWTVDIPENDPDLSITVERRPPLENEATVQVVTEGETALSSVDFEPINQTLVFQPGEARRRIRFRTKDDAEFEGTESVVVRLVNESPVVGLGVPQMLRIRIQDDERGFHFAQQPPADYEVYIPPYEMRFAIVRSGSNLPSASVTLRSQPASFDGPQAFPEFQTNVVFALGASSREVLVPVPPSAVQITARLIEAHGFPVETNDSPTFVVRHNGDPNGRPGFMVMVSGDSPREDDSAALLRIHRVHPFEGTARVSYSTVSATAVAGEDFDAVSGSLDFAPGVVVQDIEVPLVNDQVAEVLESFKVVLSNPSAGMAVLYGGEATVYLKDNDTGYRPGEANTRGDLAIELGVPISVPENITPGTIPVFRDGEFDVESSVDYQITHLGKFAGQTGTATPGVDFEVVNGRLTFAPGETRRDIRMVLHDNAIADGDRSLFVRLSNPMGPAPILWDQRTILIRDSEYGPGGLAVDPGFHSQFRGQHLRLLAQQSDGRLWVASDAAWDDGHPGDHLHRLLPEGRTDPGFKPQWISARIRSLAIQPDGRALVVPDLPDGETRFMIGSIPQEYLARLNRDGTPDPTFGNPYSAEGMPITAVATGPDDSILLTSGNESLSASTRIDSVLFRIDRAGRWDSRHPLTAISGPVYQLGVGRDGGELVFGSFTLGSAPSRLQLAAFSRQGEFLRSFDSPGFIRAIHLQSDGGVLAVLDSATLGGDAARALVRFGSDGKIDSNFPRREFSTPFGLTVFQAASGTIWCLYGGCGGFWLEGLHADGSSDPLRPPARIELDPHCAHVTGIFEQSEGWLLLTGGFTSLNGALVNGLARIRHLGSQGAFELSPDSRKLPENVGRAELRLRRMGSSDQAVGLRWRTGDGSARDGMDYTAAGGRIEFGALESEKVLPVEILDNDTAGRPRWFDVHLEGELPDATPSVPLPVFIASEDLGAIPGSISALPDGRIRFEVLGLDFYTGSEYRNVLEVSDDLAEWSESPVRSYQSVTGSFLGLEPSVVFDPPPEDIAPKFYRIRTVSRTGQ